MTGSIVGTRQDLAEVFRLRRLGHTRVIRETRRLEDIDLAIDEPTWGRVTARSIFDLRRTAFPAQATRPRGRPIGVARGRPGA